MTAVRGKATVTIDPPTLSCGEHTEHEAIVAIDVCGCIAGMSVLSHHEPDAYRFAAVEAKAGLRVETWTVTRLRAARMCCPDHPKGPPWWESNGGKGKRPGRYEPQQGLGL
jgi:hypothetical protein